MSTKIHITDTTTNFHAKVTKRGELIVGAVDFTTPIFNEMTVDNQPYNFFGPTANKQFVITTVIADANRDIGATGVTVDIYEADSATESTISKQILKFDMLKNTSKILTGLNLAITKGKWINSKADDSNVLITIGGYYVNI